MTFIFSWDDGHPSDQRLSDLFQDYNIKATFFIPKTNVEGLPVLSRSQVASIGSFHEIGAHTLDHVRLNSLSTVSAKNQIYGSKSYIEDCLGRKINGFCYPGGKHNKSIRTLVAQAGFRYGRTVCGLLSEANNDLFRFPVTYQYNSRHFYTYLIHYFKHGQYLSRLRQLPPLIFEDSLNDSILSNYGLNSKTPQSFMHIWGHSWELDIHNLWHSLESLLKIINDRKITTQTIDQYLNYC